MSTASFSQLSILVIEPSATQLKIIHKQLKQLGIESIDGVSSGADALDYIEKYPPDLVISAMYLPDMSATDLLTQIRQNKHSETTNFMLISSETSFKALDPIRQAGVVAILPKPFAADDLVRALRSTLDFLSPEELELSNFDITQINVLLVDDSMMARNHIKRVLQGLGVSNIETAKNGVEAAEVLKQTEFDLIITDLNMPEMDGEQLLEFVRNELGNTYVPILMVTSEDQSQPRFDNIQQAGVSAIVDKPFEPMNVRELIYRVME
jgi:two-component system chemotaxis response regulator CheY